MKVTFNDSETRRLLMEFAAVNANEIGKAKSAAGAIRRQNATVRKYAKRINGWVLSKIESNYGAEVVKRKTK